MQHDVSEFVAVGTVTHYVVQAYRKGKRGKVEAEEPKIARDDDPVILAKHGDLPEHLG
ncbi:hypothetical protein FF80_03312 [Devosia sp. LC5]|uniref:hypothetical protein n=1 Tax=Devosia sp. LC5 TaxID=1502724 RepID=UPI0004E34E0C|nr:hypothetical protein [Devosia sp. LC5]KFC62745.1 hypothetical protein FF80_03312 [Devosia sp. LC5]